ncbi:MAG: glycerate kinase [Clostridia bacterium]|nr:glycerate kinase [Clostridia bacterium]
MKTVIAIDSFKGSLTSLQAGNAVKEAIIKADSLSEVEIFSLADGGEGTVEAMHEGLGGKIREIEVTGPIFDKVKSRYLILPDKTAVIEMAAAAGLNLVPENKRNPMNTTTFGVGELIKDAIDSGCKNFIIGIGGSATNDGGIGMLAALGYDFRDENKKCIPLYGKGLEHLYEISAENVLPELKECNFRIACDVSNPLCGKNGCSFVFAPQKGASEDDIIKMDLWLEKYAAIAKTISPDADSDFPGAGAAGGLGFAFHTFTNSVLESGIDIIIDAIGLEDSIKNCDIVVTGEGRLDSQTVMGKAPIGVAKLAKKYNKKVIAFSGIIGNGAEICNEHGIDAFFPIIRTITTAENAMKPDNAYKNLTDTAYQVFRLIK